MVQDTGQDRVQARGVQEIHQAAVGALWGLEAARPVPPGEDLSTDKEAERRERAAGRVRERDVRTRRRKSALFVAVSNY